MKVVVVGGGAAGLAAAYTLRRLGLGIQVTLLEASPHVGGRMAGDEIDGFRIDTGAQMFILKDETVLWLCEELGVPLGPYGSDTGFYDKGKFHPIGRDQYLKSILAILSPAERSQLDKFADVLRAQPSVYDYSQFLSLDTEESITEYLEKNGGADLLEKVFQNSITARTLAQPEDVGVAFGMLLLRAFIFDTSLATLTPREGIGAFAAALAQACKGAIRVSTPVQRVVIEDGTVKGVTTAEGFMAADAVICATTATAALKIIPDLPANISRVLQNVTYSRACHVVLGADDPLFPQGWFGISLPRSTGSFMAYCLDGAYKGSLLAPQGKHYLSAFLFNVRGPSDDLLALSDEEITSKLRKDLRKYAIPIPETPLFTRVYRWPEATCLMPGGMLKKIAHMRRSVHANCRGLFLAGDYMRLPSVNGALLSGIDAAKAVAEFHSKSAIGA